VARKKYIALTNPHRPNAVLREIDLNVALKQYEKVATAVEDTKLQIALGPEEEGLSDQQIAEWRTKQERKQALLEVAAKQLHAKIEQNVAEANKEAQASQPQSTRQPMAEQYGFPNTGGVRDLLPGRLGLGIVLYPATDPTMRPFPASIVLGSVEKGLSDQQITEGKAGQELKQMLLEDISQRLRATFELLIAEAKKKAQAPSHPATDPSIPPSPASKGSSPEASPKTPAVK
jgi:hypothetical protein